MKLMNLNIFLAIILCLLPSSSLLSGQDEFHASYTKITQDILKRMAYSWNEELAPIALEDLRYIRMNYYDFEGNIKEGELVVHKEAVEDILDIFKKLFQDKYPIHSMKIIDEFEGSDVASMEANNSSALYVRKVANAERLSNHSWGLSLDINPLLNPYSRGEFFVPENGERYLDRTLDEPGMITPESNIYKYFKEKGWEWGGECFYERDKTIDRHHFQKIIPGINKNTNK